MTSIARVICAADGSPTPHDWRYVVTWNPHTLAGELDLVSTANCRDARRFEDAIDIMNEWNTISRAQPTRPWDSLPNRPLTGITVQTIEVGQ
jgi:hypothetical protein